MTRTNIPLVHLYLFLIVIRVERKCTYDDLRIFLIFYESPN